MSSNPRRIAVNPNLTLTLIFHLLTQNHITKTDKTFKLGLLQYRV